MLVKFDLGNAGGNDLYVRRRHQPLAHDLDEQAAAKQQRRDARFVVRGCAESILPGSLGTPIDQAGPLSNELTGDARQELLQLLLPLQGHDVDVLVLGRATGGAVAFGIARIAFDYGDSLEVSGS